MTAPLIDTHAHLFWEDFAGAEAQVLDEAALAGVRAVIVPATNLDTLAQARALAERFPMVYFTAGIHPQDVGGLPDDWIDRIGEALDHPRCVGVGEVGLDYYWDDHPREIQQAALRMQLDLARAKQMPVVMHNRDADDDILAICEEVPDLCGQFHCFAGSTAMAQRLLDLGWHLSFTGNITYKKTTLSEISLTVPLDRLLLETDAPFMTPVPHRGSRNTPAYVGLVAERHAALRSLPVDEVALATTRNAVRLFGLSESLLECP